MAVTQNSYTGNGSTTNYAFTFPYLAQTDVKVKLDGVTQATTEYTFPNATTVSMDTAPANGATILIFRDTNNDNKQATFYPGSAIKAEDLNNNYDQILYTAQEVDNYAMTTLGDDEMIGDFKMGSNKIIFEGTTADAHETFLTVADPTADRTITLPNVSGTVVTTGDTGTVTATMLAANSVDSSELVNGSIDAEHIADAQVTNSKLAIDAVTGAKIADNTVDSEHYAAGSIDTEHIGNLQVTTAKIAADAIDNSKLADNAVGAENLASPSVQTAKITDSAVTTAKIADSAITTPKIAADAINGTKIADNSIDSEHYVDGSIDAEHILDGQITNSKLAVDAVTGAKIADDTIDSEHYAALSIDTEHIGNLQVTTDKIAAEAVTTAKIADAELVTLAGMQSGTASILASSTALAATTTEINAICDGKSVQTTISDTDASYPTSGAVVDYVAAQIAPLGGLEVIATEVVFPNTQPSSGVVISISDAGGVVFNGSGTSTTGRTVGGSTVTINNAPSSLNSETLAAGVGLMVSSTGSSQIYNYHKILGKEDDIKQLSDDINDFAERYRVGTDQPTSSLHEGDLWYDQSNDRMMVYNSTTSNWEAVTATGNFYINTISSYSGTGGNSATFNGTAYRFTISSPPNAAQQLIVSINGVIQKPNAGASQPAEGFAISGTSIIFSSAPATGSDYFIITIGSAVNIGTPSDNSISTVKLQNLSVTTDKIANDAVTGAKIADLDANVKWLDNSKAVFGTGSDLEIYHDGNESVISDTGTGKLILKGSTKVEIRSSGNEDMAVFEENGAVELYYDNTKKLSTTENGIEIHDLDDTTTQAKFISSGGTLGSVYGNSNDSAFGLLNTSGEWIVEGVNNGTTKLYYDNVKKFETQSTGVSVWGNLFMNNTDEQYLKFGAANDLVIYHHSNNWSYITHSGSGNLGIESANDISIRNTNGEKYVYCDKDGAVELYHNNVEVFKTQTNGIFVKGPEGGDATLYLYADEGDDNADQWGLLASTGGDFSIRNYAGGGWETNIKCTGNGNVELYYDNTLRFQTTAGGVLASGALESTGLIYSNNNDIKTGGDTGKLMVGAGNDLEIFHNGTETWVKNITGNYRICNSNGNGNEVKISAREDQDGVIIKPLGAVEVYHNGSKKFESHANGIHITGDVSITGNYIADDNEQVALGDGSDLRIYHDGSNSWIKNGADGGTLYIQTYAENSIKCIPNGAVELYNDGAKKFETVGGGIEVTGNLGIDTSSTTTYGKTGAGSQSFYYSANGAWQVATDRSTGWSPWYINKTNTGTGSDNRLIQFLWSGSSVGHISYDGTNVTYNTGSDYRLKENIVDLTNGISRIKQLKPRRFNWITDETNTAQDGFIAHEVQSVVPTAISGTKDQVVTQAEFDAGTQPENCAVGDPIYQQIDQSKIIPLLTAALQEAIAKIETLETKVAALEAT